MKYVVIPDDVHIIDKRTNEPIKSPNPADPGNPDKFQPVVMKHSDFIVNNICFNPDFSKGGAEGLRRKKRVEDKFLDCRPGDVIALDEADFKAALPLFDKIEWHPQFVRFADQMLPHFKAWEDAEDQDEEWKKEYDVELAAKKNGAEAPKVLEAT